MELTDKQWEEFKTLYLTPMLNDYANRIKKDILPEHVFDRSVTDDVRKKAKWVESIFIKNNIKACVIRCVFDDMIIKTPLASFTITLSDDDSEESLWGCVSEKLNSVGERTLEDIEIAYERIKFDKPDDVFVLAVDIITMILLPAYNLQNKVRITYCGRTGILCEFDDITVVGVLFMPDNPDACSMDLVEKVERRLQDYYWINGLYKKEKWVINKIDESEVEV